MNRKDYDRLSLLRVFVSAFLFYPFLAAICYYLEFSDNYVKILNISFLIFIIPIIYNRKYFKYFFYTDAEHKKEDLTNLILISVMLAATFAACLYARHLFNILNPKPQMSETQEIFDVKIKGAEYKLNELLSKISEKDYENEGSFIKALFWQNNAAVFVLQRRDLIYEPHAVTENYQKYTLKKFKNRCGIINYDDYKKSDCIIEFDANKGRLPNKTDKDRASFAIDKKNKRAVKI